MKQIILILTLVCSLNSQAQRYLTDEFPILDSIIAGTYGTSIDYQSNNQNLLFDFYAPQNDTLSQRPLIIYVHGGGFTTGSRTYPSVQMICRRMANKGYAVANIDYRLDPTFDIYNSTSDRRAMTDAMHDAKQAIRYFKANATTYKIDTSLVFIGGESAGAATSMLASFVDKQTEMNAYPMANPNDPIGSSANASFNNKVAGTLCLCGLLLDTLAMELPTDPPILWTHGTNDTYVPISLAFNIVLRATHIGLPIVAKAYQGGVHCPWYFGNPNWDSYLDSTLTDITNFLYPLVTNSTSSVNEFGLEDKITIHPNPFESIFTIEYRGAVSASRIKLISSLGTVLYEKFHQPTENELVLDFEDLEPGVYFLLIENESEKFLKRVIKR